MRLELEQKQTMQMVMTQELQQAIGLLQMSAYELSQFIREQAEENPFIEFVDDHQRQMTEFQGVASSSTFSAETQSFEAFSTKSKSMHEQLLEQALHLPLSDEERKCVRYLILNIDERGFLKLTDEEIAAAFQVEKDVAIEKKKILQSLEPRGIGAGSLQECLEWQALEMFPDDEVLYAMINGYLSELANKQWQKIAKNLNISMKLIKKTQQKIQQLNPRPASGFNTETTYITPDLTVEWDKEENSYTIHLHEHYIPKFSFNRTYASSLPKTKETSQYVSNRFKQYEWLEQSIMKRRETIMKIMHVLLQHQEPFFEKGLRALRPLTMKDVADEIEMHESTVSRAAANKIIETPAGIFELRQLFSSKLQTADGEGASQMTVKEMIRELVAEEDKMKPLSDQKIVHTLAEKAIVISRRTVAKYRDALQIPSSSKRKELKV